MKVIISCPMATESAVPKTDSSVMITAAADGGVNFCPTVCRKKHTPVHMNVRYAIESHEPEGMFPRLRLKHERKRKAQNGSYSKLYHRQQQRAFALDMATGNNNMQTVKQAAAHGQEVALVDAQILVKTHKSHAHKTDERCADIILIRLFIENDPIQKRDEYAIGRRQKGVFARCRVHQPIGLHRVRRRKACTHYSAALEVLLIKLL